MKREAAEEEEKAPKKAKVEAKEDSEDDEPIKKKSQAKVTSCVLVTGTEFKDVQLREKLKTLGGV